MILTKPQYRLLAIASFLGILEGLTWVVLSLICIIMYLDKSINVEASFHYMQRYATLLFHYYLRDSSTHFLISAESFTVAMWIYFLLDIVWVILSVILVTSINIRYSSPLNTSRCWCVITGLISFVDLLLVILLGVDFSWCKSENERQEEACTNLMIPVLTIAAKGFILWIVNVVFVYVIYRVTRTLQSGKNMKKMLLSTERHLPRPAVQGQAPPPNLYDRTQGSGYGHMRSPDHMWNNVPSRQSNYPPPRSPVTPYYPGPEQPSFSRWGGN